MRVSDDRIEDERGDLGLVRNISKQVEIIAAIGTLIIGSIEDVARSLVINDRGCEVKIYS